jgi:hypothetical protein
MRFKNKVLLILGFCLLICAGSFFIIKKMFDNLEDQLVEKCRIEALTGARIMGEIIEIMIDGKIINEKDVFDTNYVKIPGTDPGKYNTRYDKIFEKYIQRIQEEYLKDPDLIFAVLMDKNGYVPTHNLKFSHPISGDKKKDLFYSRSKRIFSDNRAIKDVIDYRGPDTKKSLYKRDTGESIWNIGAAVSVRGEHWGTFLLGVSLNRVEEIKNQMMILIIAVMFVILSLTMLSILAVIPKRMLPFDLDI